MFTKMFSKVAGLFAVGAVSLTTFANAALTAPIIDTADFTAVAGAVLVALGVFYGIKKAMSLVH